MLRQPIDVAEAFDDVDGLLVDIGGAVELSQEVLCILLLQFVRLVKDLRGGRDIGRSSTVCPCMLIQGSRSCKEPTLRICPSRTATAVAVGRVGSIVMTFLAMKTVIAPCLSCALAGAPVTTANMAIAIMMTISRIAASL